MTISIGLPIRAMTLSTGRYPRQRDQEIVRRARTDPLPRRSEASRLDIGAKASLPIWILSTGPNRSSQIHVCDRLRRLVDEFLSREIYGLQSPDPNQMLCQPDRKKVQELHQAVFRGVVDAVRGQVKAERRQIAPQPNTQIIAEVGMA